MARASTDSKERLSQGKVQDGGASGGGGGAKVRKRAVPPEDMDVSETKKAKGIQMREAILKGW